MKLNFAAIINKGFWNALDWVYPPICAGCGEPGTRLCLDCKTKISFKGEKRCKCCGELLRLKSELCQRCGEEPPPYTAMRQLADYEGVIRACLHGLKYQKNRGLGEIFASWMADLVSKEGWRIDIIMPVPLSPQRLIERGYNQASHIARPLALHLGLCYNPFGIKRIRDTRSQVGLSAEGRRQNVMGAFKAVPEIVAGKNILIADDVMTTGATLESCAYALKDAGAIEIYCLAVAGFKR